MPRSPEGFALKLPEIFFFHSDAPSSQTVNHTPSSEEMSAEENAKAAYEARLANIHSPIVSALIDPHLQRLAREATIILQDTLSPDFTRGLGEIPNESEGNKMGRIRRARAAVWDTFLNAEEGREELLTTPRAGLGEKPQSIWLGVKAEVEGEYHITYTAGQVLRKPRRT